MNFKKILNTERNRRCERTVIGYNNGFNYWDQCNMREEQKRKK